MFIRLVDVKKGLFHPIEDGEIIFCFEVQFSSAIRALTYVRNRTPIHSVFSTNLSATYNYTPTQKCWNDIKYIFRYLRGIIDE